MSVGRYDWSYSFGGRLEPEFQQWAEPVIGPVPDARVSGHGTKCNVRKDGYLIAIDEANFGLDFVAAYKRDCDRGFGNTTDVDSAGTIEKVFRKDGANFGVFLSRRYTSYEYGE